MSGTDRSGRERYSTGNPYLDRRVNGGVPAGSMLAIAAPPESQSGVLLSELANTRESVYVSTAGTSAAAVEEWLGDAGAGTSVRIADPAELLADPDEVVSGVPEEGFVFVDAVNAVERTADRETYVEFLRELGGRVRAAEAVLVLHCLVTPSSYPRRTDTFHRADQVWQLVPQYGNRTLGYRLLLTKAQGDAAQDEPIPLLLTDRVKVDTSWTI